MNKKVVAILIFIILVLVGTLLFFKPLNSGFKSGSLTIKNRTFEIEVADTMFSRMQGLSGRNGLNEQKGMLFVFDKPGNYRFWMKDMKFPLDIIWIRGSLSSQILPGKTWKGKIAGFSENLQPEPEKNIFTLSRYYPPAPVDRIFEVNAGMVQKYGFQGGDEVSISQ